MAAMKIKVLGTGAASSADRNCGYIIDNNIMLDVPNGSWKLVRSLGYDQMGINDIIFTHFHADHYFDIPFVYITRLREKEVPLNIYCGTNGPQMIDSLLKLGFLSLFDKLKSSTVVFHHEPEFELGGYKVTRHQVVHGVTEQCYSYVFDDGIRKVGFSGDTSMCDGLYEAIEGCSHFIIECSKSIKDAQRRARSHIYVPDLMELTERFPECTFYTTHMTDASRAELLELELSHVVVLNDFDDLEF